LPGLQFREITDSEGEINTILTIILPTLEVARKIAVELDTKVIADAGWHVYNNMENILEQRTITPEQCPFTCPYYTNKASRARYWRGMLPKTDDLLARSINISIGVWDPGIGAGFGVTMLDGLDVVEQKAAELRRVAGKYLK
jgi:hypothetical protein